LKVWLLRILVGLGIVALGYYLNWWFIDGRIFQAPWLFLFLVFATVAGRKFRQFTWPGELPVHCATSH
jgi:hypothetical protein